jgi:hypothetical protein
MLLFLCSFVIDFVLHIKASEPLRVVCFSHNLSPLLVIVFVLLFMNKMALTQKKKKKKKKTNKQKLNLGFTYISV